MSIPLTFFIHLYNLHFLTEIACHISWDTLATWFQWPEPAPRVAEAECRHRMAAVFVAHLPLRSAVVDFFNALVDCDGVVFADIPTLLLQNRHDEMFATTTVPRLDVVVGSGMVDELHSFFINAGFQWQAVALTAPYQQEGEYAEEFTNIVRGRHVSVRVIASKSRPLRVLLASPTTAHMNAITPWHVVSPYPEITYSQEALSIQHVGEHLDPGDALFSGTTKIDSNEGWIATCGSRCPAFWRTSCYDSRTLKTRWTMDPTARPIPANWSLQLDNKDVTLQDVVRWRAAEKCSNANCDTNILYEERLEFGLY